MVYYEKVYHEESEQRVEQTTARKPWEGQKIIMGNFISNFIENVKSAVCDFVLR